MFATCGAGLPPSATSRERPKGTSRSALGANAPSVASVDQGQSAIGRRPAPSQSIWPALTRSGVAWQLRALHRRGQQSEPSLARRRISPHVIRHTTAMHLLESGVAHELIALWLGHEGPQTTHLYVEADLEMKRRTLESLTPPRPRRSPSPAVDPLSRFLEGHRLC